MDAFNAEEIDLSWNDEHIVMLLHGYAPEESHLPTNVITDLNPFQYLPDNLPEGMWYLLDTDASKESPYGFWLVRADRVKIHSNPEVDGWRTTWDYFSSWDYNDFEETQWLMQEYTTTIPEGREGQEPAVKKMLCRFFKSGDGEQGGNEGSGEGSDPQLVFGTVDWDGLLR